MIIWYDRIGNRIEMKLYEDSDKPDFEWVKGNVIEGYRYRDGIVSMKSDDGRIIWCGVESGDFRKSEDSLGDFISNADRIRAMSDDALAEFIEQVSTDSMETIFFGTKEYEEIWEHKENALEWLQREAEE